MSVLKNALVGVFKTLPRFPVTLAVLAVMWGLQIWPVEGIQTIGLTAGHAGGAVVLTILALAWGVPAEGQLGSLRYAAVGVVAQVVSTPLAVYAARGVELAGLNQWGDDLLHASFLTPVGFIAGAAAFSSAQMPRLWRRRVRLSIIALTLTFVLYSGTLADVQAVVAMALGLAAGQALYRPHRVEASVAERRVLVAVVVLSVAVGPFFVALDPLAEGPFSMVTQLLWSADLSRIEVAELCAASPLSDECLNALDIARAHGLGPVVANLMPFVVQLVLAFGLVRGRRLAWWLSLAFQVCVMGVLVAQLWAPGEVDLLVINLALVLLPWIMATAVLVATRRLFHVATNPALLRRAGMSVAGVVLAGAGTWVAVALLYPEGFITINTAGDVLAELPLRFLPTVVALIGPHFVVPATWLGWLVYEWVGIIAWAVLAWQLYTCFARPADPENAADRARAREILSATCGDHLSFMTLWEGNRYFFDGDSYVAYRPARGIALTVGAPVGPAGTDIAGKFEDFAHHQGLSVAWYSVDADFADAHPELKRVKVAEEAVLSCANTEFKGKKFQNIRTARNKAAKQGVHTVWTTWHDLDLAVAAKITALSEEWVSDKALPEMGFTLGGLKEMQVPGTQLLYALDEEGRLHGVTSWLPVRRDGQVIGYTLDVMRRAADGFKGVMELLISEALIIAADRGCEWISLSGAPLAGAAEDPSWLDQALSRVGQELEPLYGFRTLAASKRKFLPAERPWFLCYDDELKLPAIGLAATSAYLPELNVGQAWAAVQTWKRARRSAKEK